MLALDQGVIASVADELVRIDGDRLSRFEASSVFTATFKVGERVFVQDASRGLLELREELTPVPGAERLTADSVFAMLPWGGSAGERLQQILLLGRLDHATGLANGKVNAMTLDHSGGIWIAMDDGLARVDWGAELTVFDQRNGLPGMAQAVQRFQNTLYAATPQGLFTLSAGAKAEFRPAPRRRAVDR